MKKLILYLLFMVGIGMLASCAVHSHGRGHHKIPPGQAKKIIGTKSAKPFAPGQRKKNGAKKKNKHHRSESFILFVN